MEIGQEQQILVEVGTLEFCVDLNEVLSIIAPPKMVRLPGARGAFIRAFKYLDELGAAVSMRVTFGLEEREEMQSGQILLGRLNGRLAGFWFDKVVGILKLGDNLRIYEDFDRLSLPAPEIDRLFVHQGRLIPHITLAGLLSFQQAEPWKQWLQTEKPELERRLREAEAAAAAAEAEQAAEPPVASARTVSPPPMALDELYALMDAAGVSAVVETDGTGDTEAAWVTETVDESASVTEAEVVEEPTLAGSPPDAELESDTVTETVSAPEPEPALAVPVDDALAQGLAQIAAGVSEEEMPPQNEAHDDAMFTLERKGAAYRQSMDEEQAVELGDFQIIKVGDKSLMHRIRKWLRRIVRSFLLLLFLFITLRTVQYTQVYGSPMGRVLQHTTTGEVDWPATTHALQKELLQLGQYLLKSPIDESLTRMDCCQRRDSNA